MPGTGIGDLVRSTGTQTANKSGNGYGSGTPGDITGTEYDYAYTDASGSGWAVGANPWYGGMPVSAQYQLDPMLNTTLPQRTSQTGNLHSLLTTQSGGTVHWEEAVGGVYQSSELLTFANTGNFSELAPVNTPFRAYLKCVGDMRDSNGFSWQSTVCIYPGDPGLMVFRFDQTNNTGSTISPTESDIQLIASLVGDNGANPTGAWNPANAFYGTIGAAPTLGWPPAGAVQSGTLDYTGVTPDAAVSALSLGIGAAVSAYPTALGWPANGFVMNENGASATIPTRIKFGFSYGPGTAWNITAGQTNTYYVLRVLRRNLTSADMAAIAADWKYPGTSPTVTVGSFTQWNTDERAYEFAASANALTATLDLSQTHVTVRYKPIIKVSGWTGGAPALSWGGSALTSGVDYRYYNDTATSTLYLQLYFDIVTSGATTGQRNNAALSVQGTLHSLSTTLRATEQIAAVIGVGARAQFATRVATLASVTRSAFASRVATLGVGVQSQFQARTALTEQTQTRFVTRATQSVTTRARFATRTPLATEGQSRYALRFGLLQGARGQFATRFTTALQGRARYVSRFTAAVTTHSRFVLRAALAATTQATFVFRSNLTQLAISARAQFIARRALLTGAGARFQARGMLAQAARARFALRFSAGTTAQTRFATRIAGLATPARGAFRVLLALRVASQTRYRVLVAVLQAARARFLVHALGVGWHGPGVGSATTSSGAAGVNATQNDAAEISATQEQ